MTYSLWDLVRAGGPILWPLLLCSILLVAVILERGILLARTQQRGRRFLEEVATAIKRNKVAEALALCEQERGPIAQLVQAGLTKHGRSREEIRQAIEEQGARALPALERNLAVLATLAHVAPLLGLLGTTLGLIRCFHVIQVKDLASQPIGPSDIADGLWQALLTTAVGLIIAIPAVVAYNYFARRVQRVVWDMERAASDLLNLLAGEAA